MDVGVIVLTLVVGLFGVASAVLGFIAERTKLTVSTSTNDQISFHRHEVGRHVVQAPQGDGCFTLPALLSLAATALAIMSYVTLHARPPGNGWGLRTQARRPAGASVWGSSRGPPGAAGQRSSSHG